MSAEQSQSVCEDISQLAHDQFNILTANCLLQEVVMHLQDSVIEQDNPSDPFFEQFNNLMIINLSGNKLTGNFQYFLPDPNPGLPLLFDLNLCLC